MNSKKMIAFCKSSGLTVKVYEDHDDYIVKSGATTPETWCSKHSGLDREGVRQRIGYAIK